MDGRVMAEKENQEITAGSTNAARQTAREVAVVGNRIDSGDLFRETKEITIGHGGDVYRLRLTALNKLILTK
jgi:hemin uptake protein HemP